MKKPNRLWWWSPFGRLRGVAPSLGCPQGHGVARPFQRLTGLGCRGKSKALQRVLTDLGAEKSFLQASRQLQEHHGVERHPSRVRQGGEAQARRAEGFVVGRLQGVVRAFEQGPQPRRGCHGSSSRVMAR